MIRKLLVAAVLFFSTAAHAEWREATSANFVVYTQGSEQDARDFATKLERFNYVLRRYHNVREPAQVPRFRVFLLESINAVQRMAEQGGIGGYYIPNSRALMFVGTQNAASSRGISPEAILFHEYVHHFMFQYFPATYPVWYSEGYAELWGSIQFLDNNVVEVGGYQDLRFRSFVEGRWVPMSQLLTAQSYADVPDIDLLYAEGWLLNRYMFENAERRAQLQSYLCAINADTPYRDAMNQNFGPNGSALNSELFDYAGRGHYSVVRLPFRALDPGAITVRTLGPAEQAMIEQEIKLSQGVLQRDIAARAATVRTLAARFPDDPYALALLAEAEDLAGNQAAAMTAVNHLLQIQPNNARALMRKGKLDVEALAANHSTDAAAWTAARRPLLRAMDLAPNDPLPPEAYYDSFTAQGVMPPDDAQNALYSAHELAPSDGDLSYKVALDFEHRGMLREAYAVIRPEAYSTPVRRGETDSQRRDRERLEERYRQAGSAHHETAREMMVRLEARLHPATPAAAPAAAQPPRPAGH
jgi:tetratricopeptide (TPR) repeat protein